jgi:S1-C subfamily serine protease
MRHGKALPAAVATGLAAAFLTAGPAFAELQASAAYVPYTTGGVTSDEADALRAQARDYSLEVTMAAPGEVPGYNDFVAGTTVRVVDAKGNLVLDVQDAGPILLANLPPGDYTLEAVDNGSVQTRHVRVGARSGRTQVTFLWR